MTATVDTADKSALPTLHERVFVIFDGEQVPGQVSRILSRTLVEVRTEICIFACSASDIERGQLCLL